MLSGRVTRFWQLSRFKTWSLFKCSIEDGSSFIVVPFKWSCLKLSIFSKISGKYCNCEQSEQKRDFGDLNSQMLVGRLSRFLHSYKHKVSNSEAHSMGSRLIVWPFKQSFRCSTFLWHSTQLASTSSVCTIGSWEYIGWSPHLSNLKWLREPINRAPRNRNGLVWQLSRIAALG